MKLICLNILGGTKTKELLSFIENNSDVDIFCLQELFDHGECTRTRMSDMNMNIFDEISKVLTRHRGYFAPHQDDEEGIGLFVRGGFKIEEYNDVFVHKYKNAMLHNHGEELGRNIQHLKFEQSGKCVNIINFHGLWSEAGKIDTPERIQQSNRILEYIKILEGELILCGDFNLRPNTESLKVFRDYGLTDLIQENNITSTRSSIYQGYTKYADYCFVSSGINVREFRVLKEEISDHLPLYMDFE